MSLLPLTLLYVSAFTLLQSLLVFTFLEQYHAMIDYMLQNLFRDGSFTLEQP
jgi:hypothetical protein